MSDTIMKLAFATVLFFAALALLISVSWKVALGIFLFCWSNNLAMSERLAKKGGE